MVILLDLFLNFLKTANFILFKVFLALPLLNLGLFVFFYHLLFNSNQFLYQLRFDGFDLHLLINPWFGYTAIVFFWICFNYFGFKWGLLEHQLALRKSNRQRIKLHLFYSKRQRFLVFSILIRVKNESFLHFFIMGLLNIHLQNFACLFRLSALIFYFGSK